MSNRRSVLWTYVPVYLVCMILGLAPVAISKKYINSIVYKITRVFQVSVIFVLVYSSAYSLYRFVLHFYETWEARDIKDTTQNLVNVLILAISELEGLSAIYIVLFRSRHVTQLLKDLELLHNIIFQDDQGLYQLIGRKVRSHCILFTSYIVFLSIYEPSLWPPQYPTEDLVGYSLIRLAGVLMEEHVHFYLLTLQAMFSGVNDALSRGECEAETLERLRRAHGALCVLRRRVNVIFDPLLLSTVASQFVSTCTGLYYCCVTLLLSQRVLTLEAFVQSALASYSWLFFVVARLWIIVRWAQAAHLQAQKTGFILHKFDFKSKNRDCIEEVKQFSRQILHEKTTFTAYGFLTLNESLLFTVSGAVTTYLVILLQFQNSVTT